MALPTQGFTCIYKTVLLLQKGSTDSGYTPRHAPQASVFSARLRLDYENFDAPVFTGLLRVTIATTADTICILMVSRYAKRQSRFGTVPISVGGKANTKSILMVTPYSNMPLTRHIVTLSISRINKPTRAHFCNRLCRDLTPIVPSKSHTAPR
jgi:hypothetical protein